MFSIDSESRTGGASTHQFGGDATSLTDSRSHAGGWTTERVGGGTLFPIHSPPRTGDRSALGFVGAPTFSLASRSRAGGVARNRFGGGTTFSIDSRPRFVGRTGDETPDRFHRDAPSLVDDRRRAVGGSTHLFDRDPDSSLHSRTRAGGDRPDQFRRNPPLFTDVPAGSRGGNTRGFSGNPPFSPGSGSRASGSGTSRFNGTVLSSVASQPKTGDERTNRLEAPTGFSRESGTWAMDRTKNGSVILPAAPAEYRIWSGTGGTGDFSTLHMYCHSSIGHDTHAKISSPPSQYYGEWIGRRADTAASALPGDYSVFARSPLGSFSEIGRSPRVSVPLSAFPNSLSSRADVSRTRQPCAGFGNHRAVIGGCGAPRGVPNCPSGMVPQSALGVRVGPALS
jgi:hypothetical protein